MLAILPIQIALGAITIWSLRDKVPNSTHVVVGATLLATSLVLTLRVCRVVPPMRAENPAMGELIGVPA